MDIKKIIEDLIAKIKNDKDFGSKFKSDPVKTVEGAVGVDLPDDKKRDHRGCKGKDKP
ncbi:MAG TPA: hypothetical protein PLY43_07350 [Ruminococcus sp.]|nr:hypothetical protein [Ruminococcus sp.]